MSDKHHKRRHENAKLSMSLAKSSLDNAKSLQSMRIAEATAAMDLELKKAQIAQKWIEVAKDAEELSQFKKAYERFCDKISRMKREIQELKRVEKRVIHLHGKAKFLFDGEFSSKRMQVTAARSLLILFRELSFIASDSRIILNKAIKENSLPNIGSEEYNTIVNDLISLGNLIDQMVNETKSRSKEILTEITQLESTHWKKVGIF
jgi:hypothetical protein